MPDQLGPYQLLNRLDGGGMGSAWRAVDTRTQREVAIKILHAELADDPDAVERLQREEQFARIMRHPNIVQVLESGVHDGRVYVAMELVDGESLKKRLQRGPLPVAEALHVTWCVARALAEAHDVGVVHRDIKPGNILLDGQGKVKVTDFGIARSSEFSTLTVTGMFLGAPAYAAPEAIEGELDARSDLYSLGITLYEMLFGRLPFEGGSPEALLRRHAFTKPDLRPLRSVPPPVAAIVTRLLRRNPRERYPTAHALIDAIAAARAAAQGRVTPVPAAPPPPPTTLAGDETVQMESPAEMSALRRWWPVAAAVVAVLTVAVAAIVVFTSGGGGGTSATPTAGAGVLGDPTTAPTAAPTAVVPPRVAPVSGIVSNTEPDICVNMRAEPSLTAQIRRCAVRGERLTMESPTFRFAEDLVWWNTRGSDGTAGWVAERYLLLSTRTVEVNQELRSGAFTVTLVSVEAMLNGRVAAVISVKNDGATTDFSTPLFQDGGLLLIDRNGTGQPSEETANLAVGNALETGESVTGWHRFDASGLDTTRPLTLQVDGEQGFTFTLPR